MNSRGPLFCDAVGGDLAEIRIATKVLCKDESEDCSVGKLLVGEYPGPMIRVGYWSYRGGKRAVHDVEGLAVPFDPSPELRERKTDQPGKIRQVLQVCKTHKVLVEHSDHGPTRWKVELYVVHSLGVAVGSQ